MTPAANMRKMTVRIPDDKTSPTYAAIILLRAFRLCMRLQAVPDAMGLPCGTDAECAELHRRVPFLPPSAWVYRRPVRAVVAAQWPALSAYLIKHEGEPEKLLRAVPQIEKLVGKAEAGHATTSAERREAYAATAALRQVTTANRAARAQQESTQRGAWNVVKG